MIEGPSQASRAAAFLFAPGAGAPSSSAWMQSWRRRLQTFGSIETFDYPYRREGRGRPDPLPVLIAAHRNALEGLRVAHSGPVVLIGKSMGSRVGCHLALEAAVSALVCLGYPLRGASRRAPLRDGVLLALRTPVLFVQGTRDSLCPLAELRAVMQRMSAPHRLHVVEGGDHSLLVTKTALRARGVTQDDVDHTVIAAIGDFLATLAAS